MSQIIHDDLELWKRRDDLDGFGLEYGDLVVKTYADAIEKLEESIFEGISLSEDVKEQLKQTVRFIFTKDWEEYEESGVVIAGIGETEPFPVLLAYNVGPIAAGRLRYAKVEEARVNAESEVAICPFAQRDIIDTIISGIYPDFKEKLVGDIPNMIAAASGKRIRNKEDCLEKIKEDFNNYLENEIIDPYVAPMVKAVSALPRHDLAKMAEALVTLTAFIQHMSADRQETVTEPIDVALLSKGDGFTWVKHKSLIQT